MCGGCESLFVDDVLDVVDDEPFDCAVVDLAVALRLQVYHETPAQVVLCLAKAGDKSFLLPGEQLFGESFGSGCVWGAFLCLHLLQDNFLVDLGVEANGEAFAVSACQM